jgi:hypothetical protein
MTGPVDKIATLTDSGSRRGGSVEAAFESSDLCNRNRNRNRRHRQQGKYLDIICYRRLIK